MLKNKSLFGEKLDGFLESSEDDEISLILKIVSFLFWKNHNNTDMINVYKMMAKEYGDDKGLHILYMLIDFFNGKSIDMVSLKDFHENISIAICYYYKDVLGLDWEEIKKRVPFDVNAVSISSKIKSLNNWMKNNINYIVNKHNSKGDNDE